MKVFLTNKTGYNLIVAGLSFKADPNKPVILGEKAWKLVEPKVSPWIKAGKINLEGSENTPVTQEPVVEEVVVPEPIAEEPVIEEPVDEEPIVEEIPEEEVVEEVKEEKKKK